VFQPSDCVWFLNSSVLKVVSTIMSSDVVTFLEAEKAMNATWI